MTHLHLDFAKVPHLFDGQPPAWTASSWPWTFVVTENKDGTYAASANDARSPLPAHIPLGDDYANQRHAQAACAAFLAKTTTATGKA